MSKSEKVARTAQQAARSAKSAGQKVEDHPLMRAMVTTGLIAYGLVHVVVAWLAVQVAWGGRGEQADQNGALQELAQTPFGPPVLWVLVVGLFALVLWQIFQAAWGHTHVEQGRKRTLKRLTSVGKAVIYTGLGVAAARVAQGGRRQDSDAKQQGLTAKLLAEPFGRVLVIVVALILAGIGANLMRRGIKASFTKELIGAVPRSVVRIGQAGYIAKGVAMVIVGGLFGWAAISYDPKKAGGLDDALRTVREAPLGSILLTLLALGFAAFGVYCWFWSRRARV